MAIFIYSPALTQVMSRRVRKFNLNLGHAPQVFGALGALPQLFQPLGPPKGTPHELAKWCFFYLASCLVLTLSFTKMVG